MKPSLTKLPDEWYNLPTYYKTNTTEIYGPDELVPWPGLTDRFDYELEIATIIGKQGRNVPEEEGRATSTAEPSTMTGAPATSRTAR